MRTRLGPLRGPAAFFEARDFGRGSSSSSDATGSIGGALLLTAGTDLIAFAGGDPAFRFARGVARWSLALCWQVWTSSSRWKPAADFEDDIGMMLIAAHLGHLIFLPARSGLPILKEGRSPSS